MIKNYTTRTKSINLKSKKNKPNKSSLDFIMGYSASIDLISTSQLCFVLNKN